MSLTTGTGLPGPATSRVLAELDEFGAGLWGGDNGTAQMAIVPLADDRRFRAVARAEVYTRVLQRLPQLAPWLDVLEPISDVFPMGGLHNTLRRLVHEGRPVVAGLVAVGDTVCCTNPTLGRGLSLALQNAVDLVEVVRETGGDPLRTVAALDEQVVAHVAPFYLDQARTDRARLASLRAHHRNAPAQVVADDPARVSFAELRAAAAFDADVFRACFSVMGMLTRPEDVYTDPRIVERTRAVLAVAPPRAAVPQPRGAELDALLAG